VRKESQQKEKKAGKYLKMPLGAFVVQAFVQDTHSHAKSA
jgi:hypothetical protein